MCTACAWFREHIHTVTVTQPSSTCQCYMDNNCISQTTYVSFSEGDKTLDLEETLTLNCIWSWILNWGSFNYIWMRIFFVFIVFLIKLIREHLKVMLVIFSSIQSCFLSYIFTKDNCSSIVFKYILNKRNVHSVIFWVGEFFISIGWIFYRIYSVWSRAPAPIGIWWSFPVACCKKLQCSNFDVQWLSQQNCTSLQIFA